jgi:threonine/homoserine/homoserine lactone efflux protein
VAGFAAAVLLLLITPGPGVLSTAGIGAGFGRRAGLRYLIGLVVGTDLVAMAVISGLAVVVRSIEPLRVVLFYASIAYLAYLAARIALAGTRIGSMEARTAPDARDGVILQLINPKAWVGNTTLFSGFPLASLGGGWETALKLVVINTVWIPIHLPWLAAGVQVKRLALPPRVQVGINLTMAAAMLGVVGLAAASG